MLSQRRQITPIKASYPRWSNYHTSPMREGHVVVVLQTPTDRAITHTLLALFQLLQETKVSGHN